MSDPCSCGLEVLVSALWARCRHALLCCRALLRLLLSVRLLLLLCRVRHILPKHLLLLHGWRQTHVLQGLTDLGWRLTTRLTWHLTHNHLGEARQPQDHLGSVCLLYLPSQACLWLDSGHALMWQHKPCCTWDMRTVSRKSSSNSVALNMRVHASWHLLAVGSPSCPGKPACGWVAGVR